jgi:hypothetical protein
MKRLIPVAEGLIHKRQQVTLFSTLKAERQQLCNAWGRQILSIGHHQEPYTFTMPHLS